VHFSASLGYTTSDLDIAFQAEVNATNESAAENIDRRYKNRNICILLDRQAAIKALENYQITSKLVWHSHQSLLTLAEHKEFNRCGTGLQGNRR
jgi:hypothetical protein